MLPIQYQYDHKATGDRILPVRHQRSSHYLHLHPLPHLPAYPHHHNQQSGHLYSPVSASSHLHLANHLPHEVQHPRRSLSGVCPRMNLCMLDRRSDWSVGGYRGSICADGLHLRNVSAIRNRREWEQTVAIVADHPLSSISCFTNGGVRRTVSIIPSHFRHVCTIPSNSCRRYVSSSIIALGARLYLPLLQGHSALSGPLSESDTL